MLSNAFRLSVHALYATENVPKQCFREKSYLKMTSCIALGTFSKSCSCSKPGKHWRCFALFLSSMSRHVSRDPRVNQLSNLLNLIEWRMIRYENKLQCSCPNSCYSIRILHCSRKKLKKLKTSVEEPHQQSVISQALKPAINARARPQRSILLLRARSPVWRDRLTDSRVFNPFSVVLFWMHEIIILFVQMSSKLSIKLFPFTIRMK